MNKNSNRIPANLESQSINFRVRPKNTCVLGLKIIKTNFPWLAGFTDKMVSDHYLSKGYALEEIAVPKEFLKKKAKTGAISAKLKSETSSKTQSLTGRYSNNNQLGEDVKFSQSVTSRVFEEERKVLIDKICSAFRRNGYTYYEQYLYLKKHYDEHSLYSLAEENLRTILLDLTK